MGPSRKPFANPPNMKFADMNLRLYEHSPFFAQPAQFLFESSHGSLVTLAFHFGCSTRR